MLLGSLERGLENKDPAGGIKHVYDDLLKLIWNIL